MYAPNTCKEEKIKCKCPATKLNINEAMKYSYDSSSPPVIAMCSLMEDRFMSMPEASQKAFLFSQKSS